MNRSLLVSPVSVVLVVVMTVFAGSPLLSFDQGAKFMGDQTVNGASTNEPNCRSSKDLVISCREMEQRILSSTLRIEIKTWIIYIEGEGYASLFSNGHGTVMDGRYLLTHNHFTLPLLELLSDDFNGKLATITLYTAGGEFLWEGPLTTAAVAFDDTETLLLEFQDKDGRGLFEMLGIPSAEFSSVETQQLPMGTNVAQVNWDNKRAFVQWTNVKGVSFDGGTPVISMEDCIIGGSSGGGVYLNGVHMANNWSRSGGCVNGIEDESLLYSKAALNSSKILAVGQPQSVEG